MITLPCPRFFRAFTFIVACSVSLIARADDVPTEQLLEFTYNPALVTQEFARIAAEKATDPEVKALLADIGKRAKAVTEECLAVQKKTGLKMDGGIDKGQQEEVDKVDNTPTGPDLDKALLEYAPSYLQASQAQMIEAKKRDVKKLLGIYEHHRADIQKLVDRSKAVGKKIGADMKSLD